MMHKEGIITRVTVILRCLCNTKDASVAAVMPVAGWTGVCAAASIPGCNVWLSVDELAMRSRGCLVGLKDLRSVKDLVQKPQDG